MFFMGFRVNMKTEKEIFDKPYIQNLPRILQSGYTPPDGGIGDFSIVRHEGKWHVFFIHRLFGRPMSPHCNEQEIGIGHAISNDLLHWQTQDDAIQRRTDSWDWAHVWAPSVVRNSGRWYMFYTGMDEAIYQRMGVAVSEDLTNWQYPQEKPVLDVLDYPWAKAGGVLNDASLSGYVNCRDPFVVKFGDDWLCYYTALSNTDKAVIAVASSRDLISWKDGGIVAERPIQNAQQEGIYMMESPAVFDYNDRYYLVYNQARGIKYIMSENPFDFSAGNTNVLIDGLYNFEMLDRETGLFACANMGYYSSLRFGLVDFDKKGLMHFKSPNLL